MDPRLREAGERLQEQAACLVDYREIDARTRELGCHTSERTIRFYVSEGVLPPPPARRGGKTPVFELDWILPVLMAIHLMKARFGQNLAQIRSVVQNLRVAPTLLVDKLEVLYNDVLLPASNAQPSALGGWVLSREQAHSVVKRFFTLLAEGDRQVCELSVLDTVAHVCNLNRDQEPDLAMVTPASLPDGAVLIEGARALEELFIGRFDERMAQVRKLFSYTEGCEIPAGVRERTPLRSDASETLIDLMKRHKLHDRSLLNLLPLNAVSRYDVFKKSLLGRRQERLVVAACVHSPLEELVRDRCASTPAGPEAIEATLDAIAPDGDRLYLLGILSTTGWQPEAECHLPSAPNVVVALVEHHGGSRWVLHNGTDPRWHGSARLLDPESEREKIDRVGDALRNHPELSLRGGHAILANVQEDLGVAEAVFERGVQEVLAKDGDLSMLEVGGKRVVKRKRL